MQRKSLISCCVLKEFDLIDLDLEISVLEAVDLVTHPDINPVQQGLVIAVPHA